MRFRETGNPVDQSVQMCPGHFPLKHHGCWSQKSPTTNISAAPSCHPLSPLWLVAGDILFLENSILFEEEEDPHPPAPLSLRPLYQTAVHYAFVFTYSCHAVCFCLLMVSLTIYCLSLCYRRHSSCYNDVVMMVGAERRHRVTAAGEVKRHTVQTDTNVCCYYFTNWGLLINSL